MDENWITETCLTCHVQFKITAEHESQLKESHKSFYCPSGHKQFYPAESKAEKLEKELEHKQNHIKRLYDENEKNLQSINLLKKKLKDATEKKVEKKAKEPSKPKTKKQRKRGRRGIFDPEDIITTHHGTMIYKPVVKYLADNLEPTFILRDIIRHLGIFYQKKLKRLIRQPSIRTYARNYRDYLLSTGEILEIGDGNYQLKEGGEPVEPETPSKKPPVKLSYLEKWLIKKMPRKPFDIEQFYNDYPKQRHHKKNTQAVILDLIKRRIISQVGPNRFKLNRIKPEEGK